MNKCICCGSHFATVNLCEGALCADCYTEYYMDVNDVEPITGEVEE